MKILNSISHVIGGQQNRRDVMKASVLLQVSDVKLLI
jgi:hypothetical protein